MKVIIHKEDGKIVITTPNKELLTKYSIDDIAKKDVPYNIPYKIVDEKELPKDLTYSDAWVIDDSEFTDGRGGKSHEFS